ncbi:SixA phosphatase family protein [Afifella pfennigii]|uniref:SixA phosphatase family protein n=1 Tax=Afifella pfennigii TaxID=209897 RepID=UPI00068FCB28|nr:histidine phosphatase family protein [Afifella pfennigii]
MLLLRHAKSDWHSGARTDFERPLNQRGRNAARAMGQHLADAGYEPDLVLCSPARRTRETLGLVAENVVLPVDRRYPQSLYEEVEETYVNVLRAEGGGAECCLLVGHNPMIYETALVLVGSGGERDLARLNAKFPSGALAVLEFSGTWSELTPGTTRLARYVRPADLVS